MILSTRVVGHPEVTPTGFAQACVCKVKATIRVSNGSRVLDVEAEEEGEDTNEVGAYREAMERCHRRARMAWANTFTD